MKKYKHTDVIALTSFWRHWAAEHLSRFQTQTPLNKAGTEICQLQTSSADYKGQHLDKHWNCDELVLPEHNNQSRYMTLQLYTAYHLAVRAEVQCFLHNLQKEKNLNMSLLIY